MYEAATFVSPYLNTMPSFEAVAFGQPQSRQDIKSVKTEHDQDDPMRLRFDKMNHRFRIRQKLRLHLVASPRDKRGRCTRSPNRDSHRLKTAEVHPHDSRRNRDQMAHHRQQARKKNAAGLITTQPNLGAFQFFRADEKTSSVAHDQGATNEHARSNT